MPSRLIAAIAVSVPLLAYAPPVLADPATPEGAQSLQTVFQRYLGTPAAGKPDAVAVTPQGESYKISLDFQTLAAPLRPLGILVAMAPFEILAKPGKDGLWQVSAGNFPAINISAKSQTISLSITGHEFSGTFDPAIRAFVLGTSKMSGLRMVSLAPGFENLRNDGAAEMTMTSVKSGPGAVSAVMQQSAKGSKQTFRLSKRKGAKPAMEVSVSVGPMNTNLILDQLKNSAILDLWAFAVANPSGELFKTKFEEVRAILKRMMPLFNSLNQTVQAKDLQVTTPYGAMKVASINGGMNVAGLVPKGQFNLKIAVGGLSLPPVVTDTLLPPWSKGLVPTQASFDVTVSGYNLAAAADNILAKIDPKLESKAMDELMKASGKLVVPNERVNVRIRASKIVADKMEVELFGDMVAMKPMPTGKFTVRVKGLDETIKFLQPFVSKDKNLQKAMLGMIAGKGFGKALPDGRLEWVIIVDGSGKASVNGFKFPIPGAGRRRR